MPKDLPHAAELKASMRQALDQMVTDPGVIPGLYTPDAIWRGSHPWNFRQGPEAIAEVWADLHQSLHGLTRRQLLSAAGENHPDDRIPAEGRPEILFAAVSYLDGTFAAPLFGIPANGERISLRLCEVHEPHGPRIGRSWVLIDLLHFMEQVGVEGLWHTGGERGFWPEPGGADPDAEGHESLAEVLAMHQSIGKTTGDKPHVTDHARHWTPDFLWAGPGGIGMTRGLDAFRAFHQLPFLEAFPDRGGAGHYIRIGDGDIAVTGGWPSVVATHHGPYLGTEATGRPVEMRVMDFYRVDKGKIAENWVPIDMIHLALQMGVHLLPEDPTA